MRTLRYAGILTALTLGACRSHVASVPPQQGEPVAAHPAPTATTSANDANPQPPAVVEPVMPFDEAWALLRADLPQETERIQPAESNSPLDKLLAWAAPGAAITVFDRACSRLQVTRNETTLDGDIHVKSSVSGGTKTVSGESIAFGWEVSVVCGFENTYERAANGAWTETRTSATGCASRVGYRLSEVTDTEVWYGGVSVELTVKCGLRREQVQRCLDGSERTCARCERLGVDSDSRDGHFHKATAAVTLRVPAVDCAVPCPRDERGETIQAVNAALHGRLEQVGLEPHPTLFRTRAACWAYRQHHRIAAADLATW